MHLFESVKTNISVRDAAQRYGMDVNHSGMALCPFHNDRHPSLYVADDHFYCFACGKHGDVIDLTAELFGVSFYDAAEKLSSDFGIFPHEISQKVSKEIRPPKTEAQRLREKERLCFFALKEHENQLRMQMAEHDPTAPDDLQNPYFAEACHNLSYTEYLIDTLLFGDSYERSEVVNLMFSDGKLKIPKICTHKEIKEEKNYGRNEK